MSGNVRIDPIMRHIWFEGWDAPLSVPLKQLQVFSALLDAYPRWLVVDEIAREVWGKFPPCDAANVIRQYVWSLRTALDNTAWCIVTDRKRGYRLLKDNED